MSKRTYRLGLRAQGMADTRTRVIEAARSLFLATGFHDVSVDAIAAAAGVGRTTVFQQFGCKSGLLRAVEEETGARAGVDEILQTLAFMDREPLRALRIAFERGCEVWAKERAMFDKLFSLAAIDPELSEVMAQKEARRRELVDALVLALSRHQLLRPGVSRRTAGDLMWALTSFKTFDALFALRGSAREVARLMLTLTSSFIELGPARAAKSSPAKQKKETPKKDAPKKDAQKKETPKSEQPKPETPAKAAPARRPRAAR